MYLLDVKTCMYVLLGVNVWHCLDVNVVFS